MKDAVNGHLLQLAAAQALQRYPYYAVRCVSDGREYLLEPHSEPIAVHNTPKPVALGGEESNGYLLAVSYWEDKIWVNLYHGLTDATGALNFGRTLLYYYCRAMYDPNLSADGVRINDGPIPPEDGTILTARLCVGNGCCPMKRIFSSRSSRIPPTGRCA